MIQKKLKKQKNGLPIASQKTGAGSGAGTIAGVLVPAVKECKNTTLPAANAELQAYIDKCEGARNECIQSCESEKAQKQAEMDAGGAANAENNKQYCQSGDPKKNEDAAQQGQMDIGQIFRCTCRTSRSSRAK